MFGDKLKELRKAENINQKKLGEYLEVAKNTISNWENNITQPPLETVKKIAQYFGVSTDYLLGFTQEDFDKMDLLRRALIDAGIEDIDKAMQIVEVLKENK